MRSEILYAFDWKDPDGVWIRHRETRPTFHAIKQLADAITFGETAVRFIKIRETIIK